MCIIFYNFCGFFWGFGGGDGIFFSVRFGFFRFLVIKFGLVFIFYIFFGIWYFDVFSFIFVF